jgi:hypothetical protein
MSVDNSNKGNFSIHAEEGKPDRVCIHHTEVGVERQYHYIDLDLPSAGDVIVLNTLGTKIKFALGVSYCEPQDCWYLYRLYNDEAGNIHRILITSMRTDG